MHEVLAILKKDVRRLWWQIGAAAAASAILGCMDARRAMAQPLIVEGLLNMLLPLVWACLIAQAIHHEALVGDREFWMTRPYRWPRLLAAKALFAALSVHLPSLVTDAAILAARGYNPVKALPQLLMKQLLLAEGLTLPAMVLAALVSNLIQFVIGIPVLFVTLTAALGFQRAFPLPHAVAHLAIGFVAVAAVPVALLQFRGRRTGLARILAASTLLAAGLLATLAAAQQTFALKVDESRANIHPAMTLAPPDPRAVHGSFGRRMFTTLPFRFPGLPGSDEALVASVSMDISGANGVRYHHDPLRMDFDLGVSQIKNGATTLFLGLTHAAYNRIKDSKVTISGTAGFVVYERDREVRLPVGPAGDVSESIHCSSDLQAGQYDDGSLDVFCDSPSRGAALADIRIYEMSKGVLRTGPPAFGSNSSPSPLVAWLSPLQRWQRSFQLPSTHWTGDELAERPVAIVPLRLAGYSTVSFKATDIDLREYTR
ncbi:MAG TPA: hypothetical protein VKF41_03080 [Bryobacteraceae bacterium]|nr:hypothetical protein [Bryobacteraceae bacterium]